MIFSTSSQFSITSHDDAKKENELSNALWIQNRLKENFKNSTISVTDTRKDDNHLEIFVCSDVFQNLSLVQRHKKIYAILDHMRQGKIHALSIKAQTPEEIILQK